MAGSTRRVGFREALPLVFLAVFGVALVAIPGIPPLCPMRLFFRMPCPSCGLTRATRLVLAGELGEATRMHPLWFLVLPFVFALFAVEAHGLFARGAWGQAARVPAMRWAGWAIVVLLVVVWALRELGALGGPVSIA